MFTDFTESFSLKSSKTAKHMIIKLCMRQSYQNCQVSVQSPFLYHIWKVLIWNTAITINAKCLSVLSDVEETFHNDCEKSSYTYSAVVFDIIFSSFLLRS